MTPIRSAPGADAGIVPAADQRRRTARTALLVAAAYYVGAKIGFALTLAPQAVTTLWPPNAIVLAALLLTPTRSWWLVLLAALPAHLAVELGSGVPAPMVASWFVSNCSEALIGAGCVRLVTDRPMRLDSFSSVGLFVGLAAFLAAFLSSFLDVGLVMLNRFGALGFWDTWRTRFFSNVLAALTLVPVIVAVGSGSLARLRDAPARRYVEGGLLAAGLAAVCAVVFVVGPHTSPALLYTPLPLLLWAAVAFGPASTSVSVLFVAVVAIWGAVNGRGPFVASTSAENALAIQLFLIAISVPLMTLAAVMEERRRAADAVRRTGQQLELALDAAQLGTWNWNISGDTLSWSSRARAILGVGSDERDPPLERFLDLLNADDRPAVLRAVARAVERCAEYEAEFRLPGPEGRERWVMSKGRAQCDGAERPVGMVGVVGDITERKRAEEQTQARRSELTRASRAALLGELAGALAHELNQPLTAIMANAQAGKRLLAAGRPDAADIGEILRDVVQDAQRASDVIHRLHALVRKGDIQPRLLDVNEVVTDVVALLEGELKDRGVSMDLRLAPVLPGVIADPAQLQQVVFHLIVNACEAVGGEGEGRRVTITTTRTAEGAVQISIADAGVGIPADKLDHVFQPFVTSKERRPGMGLAISRSIVKAHSGRLWAVNNPDRGATFHVVLPGAEPAVSAEGLSTTA